MKIYCRAFCILLLLAFSTAAAAQDFSNKGKDFWVGYGLHARMFQNNSGGTQEMVLYFATEAVTNITVSIPGLGYSVTYNNVAANTIFTTNPLPKTGTQDARLTAEGVSSKGIHITADKPIVAYAHVYNGNVSGATLLFPTNTLGKEYYALNFEQHSNEANSNSFLYAIAADTGTTTVEVLPSANTQTMTSGTIYTYNLTQGQVLNIKGVLTGNDGVDITGTRIRSISLGAGGCKRIAVFSGSGKINIRCPVVASGSSADNFMVQAFPKNAWGKYYVTVPTSLMPNNFYRIAVSDPTTIVKVNGITQTALINNFYYQVGPNATPNIIEANKPIMVAQYVTSAGECGNATGGDGDPEVIYLSPVEQNISKVILNSTPNSAINPLKHFVNVVLPTAGTAINSFRIDGVPPTASFVTHPGNPAYSYLVQQVSQGQHTVTSDSGFNAVAYGYGQYESYGYNAGANVKDLYQFVSIKNQYATVNFPAACKNSPFYFSIVFPYEPAEIKWLFNGLFPDVTVSSPVYDSTWTVNGRQLYRYRIAIPYSIPTIGTYPIRIIAQNPTPEGCSGVQEVDYDLQVFDRPSADFNFSTTGCMTDPVSFTSTANPNGRTITNYSWDFADGANSTLQNPSHTYATAGGFNVKFSVITDIGCLSDTVTKLVQLDFPPVAKFGISTPGCAGKPINFTDSSTTASGSIVKWTWNFGDGSQPVVTTTNSPQAHSFASAGTYTVSLLVENAGGCKSILTTKQVVVGNNPVADFNFGNACLPSGQMNFTNASTIGGNSSLAYQWTFSDGGSATDKDPQHNYGSTGPHTVKLLVTSQLGCVDSVTKTVSTIYAQPLAAFTAAAETCFGSAVSFADNSTAAGSTVTAWAWNFGDGATSTQASPSHSYNTPGVYAVTLAVTSAIGCTSAVITKSIEILSLPVASFTISNPLCVNGAVTFNNNSTSLSGNIVKWTWNFGDGSAPVVAATGSPVQHTYSATGSYNTTLIVETDKGCMSTMFSNAVVIRPLPVPGFTLPANCLTDPFSPFFDTSTIPDGTAQGFTYLWNFGDVNATPSNPNTSTVKNPTHKFIQTGNYNVSLTVTSQYGCSASVSQSFTMNGTLPVSSFTINGGLSQCSNRDVTITNNSSVDIGNVVKLEIFWDYGNDPTIKTVVSFPTAGTGFTHSYPEFFAPATRVAVVRVVAYSGDNCLNTTSQQLTLKATPDINFTDLSGICLDQPAITISAASVTNLTGSGVYSGNGINSSGLFNPATAGVGSHTIRYTFNADNGCTNFKEKTVAVFAVPTANAGPDRFVLEGGSAVLAGSGSGNGLSYLWTPPTSLSNAAIAQPTVTPADDGTYILTVTSADGCKAADEVFVKLLKAPFIPNTFSPNGDGVHDRWEISYLESYPGATVEVFNRYGQAVYKSFGYTTPWDGTYQGKGLPAGTYYYIINPKNGRKQLSGFVDIIR